MSETMAESRHPPPRHALGDSERPFTVVRHDFPLFDEVENALALIQAKSLQSSNLIKDAITILEAEISDSELDYESESNSGASSWIDEHMSIDVIQKTFQDAQSQWVDDPIISQWRQPGHHIHRTLSEVDRLYHAWSGTRIGPFSPLMDETWLHTGRVLREVGLPWHNNQINMPDEVDTSWPFHFKSFEVDVIRAKGRRVGDPNPSGYVCNWGEANCYSIRALQQELREKCPNQQPLLVYDKIDTEIIRAAEKLFGLQTFPVDLWTDKTSALQSLRDATSVGSRPIIFAATLASAGGAYDNMESICELSESLPLILHVDASRNFDFITTLAKSKRQELGIASLTLGVRSLDQPIRLSDQSFVASTIVAGGANYSSPAAVVALKPLMLGSVPTRVAYTRASDSTLAGSRDAIAPLWVALQELRFGESGFQQIYRHCLDMRDLLIEALDAHSVSVSVSPYSVDILVKNCSAVLTEQLLAIGGIVTDAKDVLLTIQPSVRLQDIQQVANILIAEDQIQSSEVEIAPHQPFTDRYPVPEATVQELDIKVQSWKVATRSAAGYPFHMGSYSALGPVIGQFLDLRLPSDWIEARANEILTSRMKSFGLETSHDQSSFKGAFTNGSTMGNRVGIHTALTHFPGAFLYFSSETHYSVPKTARDCDALTNRWASRARRYSEIPCDSNGCMLIEGLVQQVIADRTECESHGERYQLVLFLNMGTTFVGARDNLVQIREKLAEVNVQISYIHMDGALDFGFDNCGVALGPPGSVERSGVPTVQGVTLSHHKAMGNMVSGEVVCYSPGAQLATLGSGVDPRAIFETWLYLEIYSSDDLVTMFEYCQNNAGALEKGLRDIGVVTKRNPDSTITVLERPPAWITEEFSLRPEGDWVHFITMPHVSTDTVDLFIDRIASVDKECAIAFSYASPLLSSILRQPVTLRRVQCRYPLAEKVAVSAQALTQPTWLCHQSVEAAIKACFRGAMTVVALDQHGQPQVVFLAESTRERTIRAGPVLIKSHLSGNSKQILDVARQLIGFMGRHVNAQIQTDEMSYMMLCLA